MASQQRIALVIGNGAYTGSAPLKNPVNDAALITRQLEKRGYEIVGGASSSEWETVHRAGMDLMSMQMQALIAQFMAKVQPGATAIVYYAGHGLQVAGKNYLVPVDDNLDPRLPDLGLVEIKPKLETLAARVGPEGNVVVFLDACRNDPMSNEERKRLLGLLEPDERAAPDREETTVAARGKLSAVKLRQRPSDGRTFIGFATAPGEYAYDGKAGSINSPFARALAKHLTIRGLEIEELYNRVASQVLETVAAEHPGERQDPWSESNLNRALFLFPRSPAPIMWLGLAGLLAGLVICWPIFDKGGVVKPVAIWMWGLGVIFGLVAFAGTMLWGSKRWLDGLLALLGPAFGYGLALAILQLLPPVPTGTAAEITPSSASLAAAGYYWTITIAGGLLYLFATAMVWIETPPPRPRTFLQWLNRAMTWALPFIIVAVLLRLQHYISAANPLLTNIAMFAVLCGIIYAASVALACRAQRGNFSTFGPFTGAVTVGLMVAALFAIYSMVAFRRGFTPEEANTWLIGMGAIWHGLLGMQLGYCFVYYVPEQVTEEL